MIHQANMSIVQEHALQRKQQILNSYTAIEKGLSEQEFNENYPAETHERYSATAIKKFVDDFTDEVEKADVDQTDIEEQLAAELTGLKKVTIEKSNQMIDMYIRQKSADNTEE